MDEDEVFLIIYEKTWGSPNGMTFVYQNNSDGTSMFNSPEILEDLHPLDTAFELARIILRLDLPERSFMTLREIKTITLKAQIIEASKNGRG